MNLTKIPPFSSPWPSDYTDWDISAPVSQTILVHVMVTIYILTLFYHLTPTSPYCPLHFIVHTLFLEDGVSEVTQKNPTSAPNLPQNILSQKKLQLFTSQYSSKGC